MGHHQLPLEAVRNCRSKSKFDQRPHRLLHFCRQSPSAVYLTNRSSRSPVSSVRSSQLDDFRVAIARGDFPAQIFPFTIGHGLTVRSGICALDIARKFARFCYVQPRFLLMTGGSVKFIISVMLAASTSPLLGESADSRQRDNSFMSLNSCVISLGCQQALASSV